MSTKTETKLQEPREASDAGVVALPEHFPIAESQVLKLWSETFPDQAFSLKSETQWRYDHARKADSEVVAGIMSAEVDAVHGTRSGPLLWILDNGLIPQAELVGQNVPAVTGEYHSLSIPRQHVHVVPWLYAEGTLPYADDASNPSKDNLTLDNYKDTTKFGAKILETINPGLALYTHYEQKMKAAQRFAEWWDSDKPTDEERALHQQDFPVLFGVRLTDNDRPRMRPYNTGIRFDTGVQGSIAADQLPLIWVPEKQLEFTNSVVVGHDVKVLPLEQLRTVLYDPTGRHK